MIRKPGLRIEEVFRKVRTKVVKDTQGKQLPWVTSSLIKDFYFVLPAEPEIDSESVQAFERGQMYYYGDGVEANTEEALKWYHKAAEKGHLNAQFLLGRIYHNGDDGLGVDKDEKEALKWYRKAAEQEHSIAQNYVDQIEANK